jgi:hypothetical protein
VASNVLQFRVDDAAKATIDAAARRDGRSRSEFLRDSALAAATSAQARDDGPGAVGTAPGDVPTEDDPQSASAPESSAHPPSPEVEPATVVRGDQLAPDGRCPDCGAPAGSHQSFCVQVTGAEPVKDTAPGGPPTMHASETDREFLARRTAELEAEGHVAAVAQSIAEGELRTFGSAAPPAPRGYAQEPCPGCGTMKLPDQQCRDCGSRPIV